MNRITSVSVLFENGQPGVKFHYENGDSRTLPDVQAEHFIALVAAQQQRHDIHFLSTVRIRRYVANHFFY